MPMPPHTYLCMYVHASTLPPYPGTQVSLIYHCLQQRTFNRTPMTELIFTGLVVLSITYCC